MQTASRHAQGSTRSRTVALQCGRARENNRCAAPTTPDVPSIPLMNIPRMAQRESCELTLQNLHVQACAVFATTRSFSEHAAPLKNKAFALGVIVRLVSDENE